MQASRPHDQEKRDVDVSNFAMRTRKPKLEQIQK